MTRWSIPVSTGCRTTTSVWVVGRSDGDQRMKAERPFYFVDSFWGQEFRRHFLRLCVASLLSPGNLPALTGTRASRFLICTTLEDWAAISADPIFRLLASYTEPVFVELSLAAPDFLAP